MKVGRNTMKLSDVTCVILNWMQSRLTLGAIRNFRKYYPDIPMIVVDNGTKDGDISLFDRVYRPNDKEKLFDNDLDKLRNAQQELNFRLIELEENIGQGCAVDYAVDEIKTPLMLLMDNDARLLKGGLLEEYLEKMEDNVFAVGIQYPSNRIHKIWVGLQFGIFRLEPIKKYNLSFAGLTFTYINKVFYLEPGYILHETLISNDVDRTRKQSWRAIPYPIIEGGMPDRIIHLKIYNNNPEQIERWDKWIDG